MDEDWQSAGFGIYVHWPFCQSKCPYCDFNSFVAGSVNQREWAKAFVSELERYKLLTPDRVVNSVFFGGGTPSLMEPELIETILTCIGENWRFARDVEITLEANPSSVETGRFLDYRGSGISRVSLGIQSLDDVELKKLGRLHSAREAQIAIDVAQKHFLSVSLDFIYARQDQTLANWEQELGKALAFGTDHLSLYQLTIEQGTAFGKLQDAGKLSGLPNDDLAADMYIATQELCQSKGLPGYEISNHAKPRAQSKHNLIYWRGGDYLGIGPGAHGRLTVDGRRFATESFSDPSAWLRNALAGTGESVRARLSDDERAAEYLMMSLRLAEGSDLARLRSFSQTALNDNQINSLVESGLVSLLNNIISVEPGGRLVLNAILRELLS